MFRKILIANRGEIACRIVRTARQLGVRSVAVYSDADSSARHVRVADEAVHIGAAAARESYLDAARILDAARRARVEAIHPGYGFLSENAGFAAACEDAGFVFIGPPPAAILAMGSKSAAKALMERAGVPLVPGYHGDDQSASTLRSAAERIGYPVLIKAVAGGGGKGMRVVAEGARFDDALASCRREAAASFGDDRVLVERYIVPARHLEVQVFADRHGHCLSLHERECSVQRRHQKVLEEAPAPGMTEARRSAIGAAAVAAARAVDYVGAGTVEFVVDAEECFFFMEMNTRLQVEHPVTEMVTGLDLVEWQLRVAAGEALPLVQEQIALRGHAIEARLYAEDPERGFLPSTGRLLHLSLPAESLYVRVDSGVEEGDTITPHYDPMIAKLVVWDRSRELAVHRMQQALADTRVAGPASNVDFLGRLVACPAFAQGRLDTGLIEREHDHLFPAPSDPPYEALMLATLATLLRETGEAGGRLRSKHDPHSPWDIRDGWRLNAGFERRIAFRADEREHAVVASYCGPGEFVLRVGDVALHARGVLAGPALLRAELGSTRLEAVVVVAGERTHVFLNGRGHLFARVDPLAHAGEGTVDEASLVAPMPGRIVALIAAPGMRVERGAPLLILEAMKMEHTIVAPAVGRLRAFRHAVGDQVSEGAELVDFERDET